MDSLVRNGLESIIHFGMKLNGTARALDSIILRTEPVNSSAETGVATNFHFARLARQESFAMSLARHEHYLFMQFHPRCGMRILEVGCGTGTRVRELAQFSTAHITGVDLDARNVDLARKYTTTTGLDQRVIFHHGDLRQMNLNAAQHAFDAVFSVESITHEQDLQSLLVTIHTLLKPDGKLAFYAWCLTESWNAADQDHIRIRCSIENAICPRGIHLRLHTISEVGSMLDNAGFALETSEDIATRRHQDIPWYRVLERSYPEDIGARFQWAWWNNCLGVCKITGDAADALLEGGKCQVFSPMILFVARKA